MPHRVVNKPARCERLRCFATRMLLRAMWLMGSLAIKMLPKHHPSRIYCEGLQRNSKIKKVIDNTVPRTSSTNRASITGAILGAAAGSALYLSDLVTLPL